MQVIGYTAADTVVMLLDNEACNDQIDEKFLEFRRRDVGWWGCGPGRRKSNHYTRYLPNHSTTRAWRSNALSN